MPLHSFWSRPFLRKPAPVSRHVRRSRLVIEHLEDRTLLSVSLRFDALTGTLDLRGSAGADTVRQALSPDGFLEVTIDGQGHSGDPASASFDPALAGAAAGTLAGIRFDGGANDTLTLGAQDLPGSLTVRADTAVVTEDVAVGGQLTVRAPAVTVEGALDAGAVKLAGGRVTVEPGGALAAARIDVSGGVIVNGGQLRAGDPDGGQVLVQAGNVLNGGAITADGGTVRVEFTGSYLDTAAAVTSADGGADRPGGSVTIDGGTTGRLFSSGRLQATGSAGGTVDLFGADVVLDGATVDASGQDGGGSVRVGGDSQGQNPAVPNARTVTVTAAATLRADALASGAGGRVVVWSDQDTTFAGSVSAAGGAAGGAGGFLDVSGKGSLGYGGAADAGAADGQAGTLLLDPKNLVVSAAPVGVLPQFNLPDPHPTSGGRFGASVTVLSDGNVVVTNPNDNFSGTNAGAVYLFNGQTGALLSALVGSAANDSAGSGGVIPLTNGNYVIRSPLWNASRGAVTWGDGTAGVTGIVSAANSLVGSNPNDHVGGRSSDPSGYGGVAPLSNGNYVVISQFWNGSRGAVTWGDGTAGVTGVVDGTNSLVGSSPNDRVGSSVTFLNNGNYVVGSSNWTGNRGAATWADGTAGVTGPVSAANSLVGSSPGDFVGRIVPLSNGNYVVQTSSWNGNVGAATWADGTAGVSGTIDATNSLVGSAAGDRVGNSIIPLANGNYVVQSPNWNGDVGAATWADGTAGLTGTISAANSLVGSAAGDQVGQFAQVLSNGNYVVDSPSWNGNVGAATWGNGTAGVTGPVSAANSLVGSSPNDRVGASGVAALPNGNYVVLSPTWNGNLGAATWGSGTAGITGPVSAANSLVGSNPGDTVGAGGNVVFLTNGNYMVRSLNWNGSRGAVTWGSGTAGVSGAVSAANSLVGSSANDDVGASVAVLANGNYVVDSSGWNGIRGAVTWGSGTAGVSGTISAANSLVGANANDAVGTGGVTALANGNYVVSSWRWNGNRGAATWGSGTAGITGTVSAANSLVGSAANDDVGLFLTALGNGNYVVLSQFWNGSRGAATWGSGTAGVTGTVSAANSLVGSSPNDSVGGVVPLSDGNYVVRSPSWSSGRGAATWVSGTTGRTLDGAGTVTPQNSLVGATAGAGLGAVTDGPVAHTFLAAFVTEGGGRVTAAVTDPNQLTYTLGQDQTVTVTPDFLTRVLNTGTAVVLQASNDTTVFSPITVSAGGGGGALTLQAGRSILLYAGITTDNGALTLIANDQLADGVVDTDRDPGPAVITMAGGTALNAGTGTLIVQLLDGAGLTNTDSGAITLQTVHADSLSVTNIGPDPGSDVVLGPVTTAGAQAYADPNGTTRVTGNLTAAAGPVTFSDPVAVGAGLTVSAGTGTVNFAGGGTQTLQSGSGAQFITVNHTGGGTLQLTSALTVTGAFTNAAGTFDANDQAVTVSGPATVAAGIYLAGIGTQTFNGGLALSGGTFTSSDGPMTETGSIALSGGGQLIGVGTVGAITSTGSTVAPLPGVLSSSGGVTFDASTTFSATLNSTDPTAGYSQLTAGGLIELGGSTLSLTLGYSPAVGDSFTLLTSAAGPIGDTFAGLPEGATFSQGGSLFQITYQGGPNGTSVVLTCVG